jgi:hypothetical protein
MGNFIVLAVTCHDKGTNKVWDNISPIPIDEHGGCSSGNDVKYCRLGIYQGMV